MGSRKLKLSSWGQIFAGEPRLTVQNQALLILMGILILGAFIAAEVHAKSKTAIQEKGPKTMQQATLVLKKHLPPVDDRQPAQVETFTFGLG